MEEPNLPVMKMGSRRLTVEADEEGRKEMRKLQLLRANRYLKLVRMLLVTPRRRLMRVTKEPKGKAKPKPP